MLQGLEPATYRDLLLSVGSHRGTRPLSPIEVASAFKTALDAGTPQKDLAAAVHLNGPTMISRFVRLLELPAAVLHLVDWGQTKATFTFTSASELPRLKLADDQCALATSAIELGLSSVEVRAIVQLRNRSKKPMIDCVTEIVQLRPTVVRRNVFVGGISSPDLLSALSQMHQVERDHLINAAIDSLLSSRDGLSARLGKDRFTVATEAQSVADVLLGLPNGFEAAIATAIEKVLNKTPTYE